MEEIDVSMEGVLEQEVESENEKEGKEVEEE